VFVAREYASGHFQNASVLDAGGHKGYFAAFAFANGARNVTSYEPESSNLTSLRQAAVIPAWTVEPAAISGETGRATLHTADSWTHSIVRDAGRGAQDVATVSLKDAIEQFAEAERLVVKLDIEGAECEAVGSLTTQTWSVVDELILEMHGWAPCDASAITDSMARHGLVVAPAQGSLLHASR
jgi:FkbM family methyltransferase